MSNSTHQILSHHCHAVLFRGFVPTHKRAWDRSEPMFTLELRKVMLYIYKVSVGGKYKNFIFSLSFYHTQTFVDTRQHSAPAKLKIEHFFYVWCIVVREQFVECSCLDEGSQNDTSLVDASVFNLRCLLRLPHTY